MKGSGKKTAAYSAAHFTVDLCCAFFVLSALLESGDRVLCLLIYNFCAFALQMPVGAAADKVCRNRFVALLGMAFVASGALLRGVPAALCAVTGIGNALFHVGGGREILCLGGERFTALGVFVSPGALGLFAGGLMRGSFSPLLPLAMLGAAAIALLLFAADGSYAGGGRENKKGSPALVLLPALLLFAVVCIRSYGGGAFVFPWKTGVYYSAFLTLALALGKAAGGFLADRFGEMTLSLVSLVGAGVLFLFYKNPLCGALAVFLFNMTMPITLGLMGRLMPSRLGLSFGILTFGLFLGALPQLLGYPQTFAMPLGAVLASAASLVLLAMGMKGAGACGK